MKKFFDLILRLHSIILNLQIRIQRKLHKIINRKKKTDDKFFSYENQLEKYIQDHKLEKNLEVDAEFYKWNYPDLNGLSYDQAKEHYYEHGYFEGRVSSDYLSEIFLKEIYKNEKILEIGPFNNPVLVNDKVKYLDVLNSLKN